MSGEKKYYWLKLHDDFFTSKRIKKLRKQAGGDTYLIIYLKMQLKALKTNGVLTFTHVEDDFIKELALDIDEEPDNVEMTLLFLKNHGMIETCDELNYFMPYVIANTGSETAAAERMRDMRSKQKLLPDRNNVTQCSNEVQTCYTEIEKEKEKNTELEKEKKRGVFQTFAGEDKELLNALREYSRFRTDKKKPLTDEAKERLLKKLEKFPREQWVEILHQSIDEGWTGIWPLKGKTDTKSDKYTSEASFKNAITDLMNG